MNTNARFVRIPSLSFTEMNKDMNSPNLANVGKEKHGGGGSGTP